MKRFFSILAVVAFTFALTSCGSDDAPERPKNIPQTVTDTKSYTFEILTNGIFSVEKEIKLEEFAKLKKEYIEYVKNAEVKPDSYVQISGVTAGKYTITNLELRVKGTDIYKSFGEVVKDETFNSLNDLQFIDRVEKELVSEKKLTLVLKGKPNKEINKNVKVEVKLSAEFDLR